MLLLGFLEKTHPFCALASDAVKVIEVTTTQEEGGAETDMKQEPAPKKSRHVFFKPSADFLIICTQMNRTCGFFPCYPQLFPVTFPSSNMVLTFDSCLSKSFDRFPPVIFNPFEQKNLDF